jgi:hypothetical protein
MSLQPGSPNSQLNQKNSLKFNMNNTNQGSHNSTEVPYYKSI